MYDNSEWLVFTNELSLVEFVECLSEVENEDVCLEIHVHVSEKSMSKIKLGFAGEPFAESMLVSVEDLVCFQVTHAVAHHDVFH